MRPFAIVVLLMGIVLPSTGLTAVTPAQKCQAALYKAAGERTACGFNAGAAAVVKRTTPDYATCEARYARSVARARDQFGAACPHRDPDDLPVPPSSTVPVARCTLTGQACTGDADCPAATVQGTCVSFGECVYAPFDGAPTTATCTVQGGGTMTTHESNACRFLGDKSGCPAGARCLAINAPTCNSSDSPSQVRLCGSRASCTSNADCILTGPNVCGRCGDLAVEGNEDCEFDLCGTQCSPTCQFAGACREVESLDCGSPCATDLDCGAPLGSFRCIRPVFCP